MAQRNNVRNIQLEDDIVGKLVKQGVDEGIMQFKPYAESVLTKVANGARVIDIPLHTIADLENFGLGSLSAGCVEVLKRHDAQLLQITELQNHLKQLNGKK